MKIRPLILLFIVAVAAIIVLILWREKNQIRVTETPPIIQTNAVPPPTATNATSIPPSVPVSTSPPRFGSVTNTAQPPPQGKWEQMQSILATQNDIPIDFYGRIEDQFGSAVANATVSFSIGVYNGYESTEKRGQVITDGNGFFTITGYKGYDLGIMPEKAGYALATSSTLFKYSHLETHPFVPNKNNPFVLKMYKLQGAEHLISFNIKTYIPVDGSPVKFDLQTGQQVQSGGDLTISLQSSPKPSVQDGYDWRVSIQMADGGIIQDSSGLGLDKMFQAPDSGYEPEFDLSFQKGTQAWTARVDEGFYFTSRNSKFYGKLTLSIATYRVKDGAIPVTLNGYLNPAGSRNLELEQQP
jgi:hypothetical protein